LLTLDSLLHAAGWIERDQAVVHSLVERSRENPLHHAHGVGVQAIFDLPSLEGAHVGRCEFAEPQTSEERHKVVATGPLVALEATFADLVAGRVDEPTVEVLTYRHPAGVREKYPLGLLGEGLELLVVGLLGGRTVEAHPPAAGRGD
jgi:hypothetical protein